MVLANNKLLNTFSYRLAGVCTVATNFTGANEAMVAAHEGIGPCAIVRAMRELTGADTVSMLFDKGDTMGHIGDGFPLKDISDIASWHDMAYSGCNIRSCESGYTMLHENAHNIHGSSSTDFAFISPWRTAR